MATDSKEQMQSPFHHLQPTITAEVFQRVIDLYERSFAEITTQCKGTNDNNKKLQNEIESLKRCFNEITTIKDTTTKTMKGIKEIQKEILSLKEQINNIKLTSLKEEEENDKDKEECNVIHSNKKHYLEISPQNTLSFKTENITKQPKSGRRGSACVRRVINFTKEDEMFNIKEMNVDLPQSVVFDNWKSPAINTTNNTETPMPPLISSSLSSTKLPDANTQAYKSIDDVNNNEPKNIMKLQFETHANFVHSDKILCITILSDERVATGSEDKSISICTVDIDNKEWHRDIYKRNAHNGGIYSLCELNESTLISCSWDCNIKLWDISQDDLTLHKSFKTHSNIIYQILKLSNKRFASCSYDQHITLYKNESPSYNEITKLNNEDGKVYAMLQLQDKEILITSSSCPSLTFWNLTTYNKDATIKEGFTIVKAVHMVELSGNRIAASTNNADVVIVDTVKYSVIKKVQVEGFVLNTTGLCLFDEFSFVCAGVEGFVQVSSLDYRIMYKDSGVTGVDGVNGVKSVEGGKYLVTMNNSYGLTVLQPFYG